MTAEIAENAEKRREAQSNIGIVIDQHTKAANFYLLFSSPRFLLCVLSVLSVLSGNIRNFAVASILAAHNPRRRVRFGSETLSHCNRIIFLYIVEIDI